jgi:hypothetical protein
MARIFRKLREDLMGEAKARKYLLYAVGEVVLVIVGILIALQVNNWNQERIEQQQVRRYAHALISDLESDIKMVEPIVRMIHVSLRNMDALDSYTRGRPLDHYDNLDLYQLTAIVGYRAYEWHRTTFEQMKNAGVLEKFRNFDLVTTITAYDSLTHHLDMDYMDDMREVREADALADEVVDSGYPTNPQFQQLMQQMSRGSLEFPSAKLHEIYADTRLQLLTDDIRKIRVMSNKYQHEPAEAGVSGVVASRTSLAVGRTRRSLPASRRRLGVPGRSRATDRRRSRRVPCRSRMRRPRRRRWSGSQQSGE